VLWNQGVHTHREVAANKPDIIIKNKKEKTCISIDVEITADRNVTQREAEKKLKHKSLCTEIQWMWDVKCVVIPAVTGATGMVTTGLKETFRSHTGETFNRVATEGSCTWDIRHNTESTAA
jgi:hypothetical protein